MSLETAVIGPAWVLANMQRVGPVKVVLSPCHMGPAEGLVVGSTEVYAHHIRFTKGQVCARKHASEKCSYEMISEKTHAKKQVRASAGLAMPTQGRKIRQGGNDRAAFWAETAPGSCKHRQLISPEAAARDKLL